MLALAGLKRLGLADAATAILLDRRISARGRAGRSSRSRRAPTTRARARCSAPIDRPRRRHRARLRARLPRRARRLLPHADRRPCHAARRRAALSRPDRQARRQRGGRNRARRRRRRRGGARRRCRGRAQGSAPVPISSRRCEACASSSPGRSPTASAPRRPCARAATPSCWRRCCAPSRSRSRCPDQAFSAVVLTSANAARAVAAHPRPARSSSALPAFAVGRRTAEAARAVGFRDVHSADGDKGRSRRDLLRAQFACASARAAALSRRRGPRRRSRRPRGRRPCTPWWSIARSRPSASRRRCAAALARGRDRRRAAFFRPQRGGLSRLRRARRHRAIGARAGALLSLRARWRRRSPPPAPLRCGSRPGRTRRRCWSWWGER